MPKLIHRHAARPQLENRTPLVPMAAAREIVDEASRWLGVPLPARYAAGLAHRARRIYAHSPLFREKLHRPGDTGRDTLWIFMRHWLADRLHREAPALYRRLPADYAGGADLPARTAAQPESFSPRCPVAGTCVWPNLQQILQSAKKGIGLLQPDHRFDNLFR